MQAVCLHGHFYQPPREHPWLGVVEPEGSAAPERDWNTRITGECYAPNAVARVLDEAGRLAHLLNAYEWTSFDFGPTLLGWLTPHAPEVMAALRRADAASRARTGHGNAWAQAYSHAILPLSTARDVRTQVLWGRRDFEHRFGRPPDGMWLPEMAVDRGSLAALAEAGIAMTMLAAHQARRVRPLGAGEDAWRAVTPATLDTRRLYRCRPAPGLAVDVVFRDGELSYDIAFGRLLTDGHRLAARLREVLGADGPALVAVAVDGETYGHHHRFGEMALAFALRTLAADASVTLAGPAAFRAAHPPAFEVEIAERTSWSCPHGVERWRADCGCRVGGSRKGSAAWRTPLRAAIDWLRDELAVLHETRGGEVLRDPWGARDRYVDCVLEPGRTPAFLAEEAGRSLSTAATLHARRVLELGRHALLMQASCGWFFDELTGLEPALVLRHVARAIELAGALGARLEDGFVARLEAARSNLPAGETGPAFYRRVARGATATPARVAASAAMLALLGQDRDVPGYDVELSGAPAAGRLAADVRVVERSTGATTVVAVVGERPAERPPVCRADGAAFTLADLFGVQHERLVSGLGREAAEAARAAGRAVLSRTRPLLDFLLAGDAALPPEIGALLGWEAAGAIAEALEARAELAALTAETAALRRRGVRFPARWLAARLARALEERLRPLPAGAPRALAVLDLAAAAAVPLDLGPAQVLLLAWWQASPGAGRADGALAALRGRLVLAPEVA